MPFRIWYMHDCREGEAQAQAHSRAGKGLGSSKGGREARAAEVRLCRQPQRSTAAQHPSPATAGTAAAATAAGAAP